MVIRTPLLPLTALVDWQAAPDPRAFLAALLARPEIEEAIFVASPSLHGAIAAWRDKPTTAANQRTERSLTRYLARMAGRATPFGLFSGVSCGVLGRETSVQLAPRAEYRRRTRLDNDYLFVLAGELVRDREIRERLRFRPSTSMYRVAGRLRYVSAELIGTVRNYHLTSLEPTEYLEATLERAANGAHLAELAEALVSDDVSITDATDYVGELVDAQVLVPDLGIHITGPEPIVGLIAQLREAGIERPTAVIDSARVALAEIDGAGLGNSPDRYRAVATTLEQLPAKVDMALLFQVDMVKPGSITIAKKTAAEVAKVVDKLARITRIGETQTLDEFRTAFRERWEDREVPLAEVLDEEAGIGFEMDHAPGAGGEPLLAGLAFNPSPPDDRVPWRKFESHMLRRLADALATQSHEIELQDADFDAMKLDRPARLPDAFSVLIRPARERILFEGSSGPSGAPLLGRFCHASPELEAIVRDHIAAEEALVPDALFAEIVHLNEGRVGNILCRPVLRAHEIAYLGISGAPREHQITLEDLLVSARGPRIVLRSRRLGREIIPRNTTAHNFRLRSMGVYRFLCALSAQEVDQVVWRWGPLGNAPYLPRVRYGSVVVSRATWNLDEKDLADVTASVRAANKDLTAGPKVAASVAALRTARKLPRFVVVAEGDNELPIDLDNPMLAAAFADEIAGTARVQLREVYPTPDDLVVTGPEGAFASEALLLFTRAKTISTPNPDIPAASGPRSFVPGSEWLFAKIYCGTSSADRVLRDAVAPVVRAALAAGDADRWFFIRYTDPQHHVRLRFRGDPAALAARVVPALARALEPLLASGVANKLVYDTYEREVERYGGDRAIDLVEEIFWRDSEAVLGILELIEGDAGADARWRLALRGIDGMLTALGLEPATAERVITMARDQLGSEVHADTAFWGRLGDRFAKQRDSLDVLFARDPVEDEQHELAPGLRLLAERDAHVGRIAAELRAREPIPPVADLAWSIVHMHVNRLQRTSQRAQELVLFDFLRRLHASRRHRR